MAEEKPKSQTSTLEIVHESFIGPVRDRLRKYAPTIKKSMHRLNAYDTVLQHALGGVGAKTLESSDEKTVMELFWDTLTTLVDSKSQSLRWAALQPFSNYHGGASGRSMWTPRHIAQDYMGKVCREDDGTISPRPTAEIYNQINAMWYYASTRLRYDNPDYPVGFYNLFMNPLFYKPFRDSENLEWYPQGLVVSRNRLSNEKADSIFSPPLNLSSLVAALGGERRLDRLRMELFSIAQMLDAVPEWSPGTEVVLPKYVGEYQSKISALLGECPDAIRVAIVELKQELVKIYCGKKDEFPSLASSGSWSALGDSQLDDAKRQLEESINDKSLTSTFLYWLMQDPSWNYYYYFVFGSTPNTSGPSLGIATAERLSREIEISASWMLNSFGKDLAMLETQVLATERTEARISYFSHLNTHTFTKGFTTPVNNELIRLRSSMTDNYEEEAISRASDRLNRFQYTMQSQEYLGIGAIDEDDPSTYLVEPEEIDADLLKGMVDQEFQKSVKQAVRRRLNDLFDDPRYARKLDATDPAHAIGIMEKIYLDCEPLDQDLLGLLRKTKLRADFALLAYHVQSVIQNAAEAIDLTAAERGHHQTISFKCRLGEDATEPAIEFIVSNTAASDETSQKRLKLLSHHLKALQDDRLSKQKHVDTSTFPPSTKSGGHLGMGLILAAMFCNAIRAWKGKPLANHPIMGSLDLYPPTGAEPLTKVVMRIPLCSEVAEVKIDRRVFHLLPNNPPAEDQTYKEEPSDREDHKRKVSMGPIPDPRIVRVLVVDDDTADRQRFRINIRSMLCCWSQEHGASSDDNFPDNKFFNDTVAFAWDAKTGTVPSYDSIAAFLCDKRSETITVFLDLAWTRKEEKFFDRLRRMSKYDDFKKEIDASILTNTCPEAFILLRRISNAECDEIKGSICIYIVTAYKSANLTRYIEETYSGLSIKSFMKWSDEARLNGIIKPSAAGSR